MKPAHVLKTKELVAVTGVNEKTLHYWDKTELLMPSVQRAQGRGTSKLYSFSDVVAVSVAMQLKRAGIDGPSLKKVVAFVRKHRGLNQLGGQALVVMDGRRVMEVDCAQSKCRPEDYINSYAIAFDLSKIVNRIQSKMNRLKLSGVPGVN